MKKIIFLLLAVLCLSATAQNHFIGVKIGSNFTNIITGDNILESADFKTGITGGITYEYVILKILHIGADLTYSQKGYKESVMFTDEIGNPLGEGDITTSYNYFAIPVKAGVSLGHFISFVANLGVVPSFLIDAKNESEFPVSGNYEEDISDKVNNYDLAGLIELGASVKLAGRMVIFLNFSYEQSFTSLSTDDYHPDSEIRNYGFGADAGIRFALKK